MIYFGKMVVGRDVVHRAVPEPAVDDVECLTGMRPRVVYD